MFGMTLKRTTTMKIGDIVRDVNNGDIGVFIKETTSPYYIEERANIQRCYVIFVSNDGKQTCADWTLRSELEVVQKGTAVTTAFAVETAA